MTDAEIHAKLLAADERNTVADITEAMLQILNRKRGMTFANFETYLRNMGSRTYLIARPRGYRPMGLDVKHLNGKRADYYLDVCLYGERERNRQLELWKGTPSTNFVALGLCGVLSVRENVKKTRRE